MRRRPAFAYAVVRISDNAILFDTKLDRVALYAPERHLDAQLFAQSLNNERQDHFARVVRLKIDEPKAAR